MITVPFALIGGVYAMYYFGVNFSGAVAVGFIALFGMAIETIMLLTIYLNLSMINMVGEKVNSIKTITPEIIRDYALKGAIQRLRLFLMIVSVSLFGLFPILLATGAGSDVMLVNTMPIIDGQQMFPNKKKQNTDAAFMEAMSSVEKENKNATLSELYIQAKTN